jgi:hypothetical protein
MSLQRLIELAPPAGQRDGIDNIEQRWQEVEARLGLQLPASYKAVASVYGEGMFGRWIELPDILLETDRYLRWVKKVYDQILEYRTPRSEIQYPLYPSPGGLLPWARDDDSSQLCWLTSGDPETWPTVVIDNHFCDEYPFGARPIDEFLVDWLEGRIHVLYYPEDIPDLTPPVFVPDEYSLKRLALQKG